MEQMDFGGIYARVEGPCSHREGQLLEIVGTGKPGYIVSISQEEMGALRCSVWLTSRYHETGIERLAHEIST